MGDVGNKGRDGWVSPVFRASEGGRTPRGRLDLPPRIDGILAAAARFAKGEAAIWLAPMDKVICMEPKV